MISRLSPTAVLVGPVSAVKMGPAREQRGQTGVPSVLAVKMGLAREQRGQTAVESPALDAIAWEYLSRPKVLENELTPWCLGGG
jgi:hypothetical protein